MRNPLNLLNKFIGAIIAHGPKNKTRNARMARKAVRRRGKFLRRKPHSATGKAWFWFQFCHSDLIIRGTCMVKQTTSKTVLRFLLLRVPILKYVTKHVIASSLARFLSESRSWPLSVIPGSSVC
jgi:hypothetical protein